MEWRAQTKGALLVLALIGLTLALGARHIPTQHPFGPIARHFDSLAPWMLICVAMLSGLLFALRGRIGAIVLLSVAALGGGQMYLQHRELSLPVVPEAEPDFRVLWFNVLRENAAWSHRIVDAALAEDPDVLIFGEAEALYPALPKLRERYAYVSPCDIDACELLVASKQKPLRAWRLSLNDVWQDRYAVTELETPGGSFFVVGNHLTKPWLAGIAEAEETRLAAQYDWLSGPVVAVGDYNAAPWSRSVSTILKKTGFRALRRPFGTWPVAAGRFGVPIDQVLVHNGARIVEVKPFGEGLNSNHLGLVADIALPK